jgi:hypothetical protein
MNELNTETTQAMQSNKRLFDPQRNWIEYLLCIYLFVSSLFSKGIDYKRNIFIKLII